MFAEELRRAVEVAPQERLSELSAALWKAVTGELVTEAEAEALSAAIEARKALDRPVAGAVKLGETRSIFPPRRRQNPPEKSVLIERRRGVAASGWMPPALASRFTLCEQAALSVVVREISTKGACELAIDAIAALAGTNRRTVQRAIRLAYVTGLVTLEERRRRGDRNLPNRVTLLSCEWKAWIARRGRGGRVNLAPPLENQTTNLRVKSSAEPSKRAAGRAGRARGAPPRDSDAPAMGGIKAMR